jgi:hypothetical protein
MLAIEEGSDWKIAANEKIKLGIAIILEKDENDLNQRMRLNGLSLMRNFESEGNLIIEHAYQYNKIDKQIQYFDKVCFSESSLFE